MTRNATRTTSLSDRIEDEFRFFKTWVSSPLKMGAVSPTSRALARLMVENSSLDRDGYALELGPGTGVVTEALLEWGMPAERIVAVEYDKDFSKLLRERFPGVNIINGDALDLDRTLGEFRTTMFSAVLSGVPILTLPRGKRIGYVEGALERVVEGGNMTQLSYSLKPPQDPVAGRFSVEKSKWIAFNLPPGRVWIYRKVPARAN